MHFAIQHRTLYRYDVPVQLGPHRLRLTPQARCARVLSHNLQVTPAPRARWERTDAFGNAFTEVEFAGQAGMLEIDSQLSLETHAVDELPRPEAPPLPWAPSPDSSLRPYLHQPFPAPKVRAYAEALAAQVAWDPVAFLDRLTAHLYSDFDHHIRHSGAAQSPEHTLATRRGACRDLTVLFVSACRSLGLPGRFVSGYQAEAESVDGQRHLHAWPEVHLPGVGFRAWDPTHGVRVRDGHVALCAAPTQTSTMPVEGGYTFDGATLNTTLDFTLRIQAS